MSIFDRLDLPGKLLFSQACTTLWAQFHHEALLQKTNTADQLAIATGLANALPGYWPCRSCEKMHPVKRSDVPRKRFCINHSTCRHPEKIRLPLFWRYSYTLAYQHVHLATKYARSSNLEQDQKQYLSKLLDPCATSSFTGPLELRYEARPTVIDCRFLLLTRATYRYFLSPARLQKAWVRLCPHLARVELWNVINRAFENPESGSVYLQSCNYCPTDYSVTRLDNQITFCTWQDLGTGMDPMDPYWLRHVDKCRSDAFPYEHGSIMGKHPGTWRCSVKYLREEKELIESIEEEAEKRRE